MPGWERSPGSGSAGRVEVGVEPVERIAVWGTVLRFVLLLAGLVIGPLLVALRDHQFRPRDGALTFVGLVAYVAVATVLRPRPNLSNLPAQRRSGLLSYRSPPTASQQVTELLFYLQVLLGPGYFVGSSVPELFWWLAGEVEG